MHVDEFSIREGYFDICGKLQRLHEQQRSIKSNRLSAFKREIAEIQVAAIGHIIAELDHRQDVLRQDDISFKDYEKIAAVANEWELVSRKLHLTRHKCRTAARRLAACNRDLATQQQQLADVRSANAQGIAFRQGYITAAKPNSYTNHHTPKDF